MTAAPPPRLARLFLGAILARGRRAVTAWIRAAKLSDQFRPCYTAIAAAGKKADGIAGRLALGAVRPIVVGRERLTLAIDDTPTKRYGPKVQGAGTHHNPTPGPAGSPFVYGHCWVVLGLLADHKTWGTVALPLLARLYVRKVDLPGIRAEDRPEFRTKLVMAVELLTWAVRWLGWLKLPIWAVADGAYAKKEFLKPTIKLGIRVVSRLRKDSALRTVPGPRPAGKRGRGRIYGEATTDLAKRAGQRRGWTEEKLTLYGKEAAVSYKTFVATWRPAGGPSGWFWLMVRRGGGRTSAPTRRPRWRTSWSWWPIVSAWRRRSATASRSWVPASSRCGGCGRT